MGEITTVGIDLAKNVFQVHGVDANGRIVVRKAVPERRLCGSSRLCRGASSAWRHVRRRNY